MRKLMEGRRPGRPGVAAKVGALLGTMLRRRLVRGAGLADALRWAFGILDPDGEGATGSRW